MFCHCNIFKITYCLLWRQLHKVWRSSAAIEYYGKPLTNCPDKKGVESGAIRGLRCEIFISAVCGQIRDSAEKHPEGYGKTRCQRKQSPHGHHSLELIHGRLFEKDQEDDVKYQLVPALMQIQFLLLECLFREFRMSYKVSECPSQYTTNYVWG